MLLARKGSIHERCPPKAKATRSNRVGCAILRCSTTLYDAAPVRERYLTGKNLRSVRYSRESANVVTDLVVLWLDAPAVRGEAVSLNCANRCRRCSGIALESWRSSCVLRCAA